MAMAAEAAAAQAMIKFRSNRLHNFAKVNFAKMKLN
jgi:hypothetical protein